MQPKVFEIICNEPKRGCITFSYDVPHLKSNLDRSMKVAVIDLTATPQVKNIITHLVKDESVADRHDEEGEYDSDDDEEHLRALVVLLHDGAGERLRLVAHL